VIRGFEDVKIDKSLIFTPATYFELDPDRFIFFEVLI